MEHRGWGRDVFSKEGNEVIYIAVPEASAQLQKSKSRAMRKGSRLFLIFKLLLVVLIQPISAETEGGFVL